jgi:hypothetical protein
MGTRKALEKLEPNTLSRGLPRIDGANRSLRTKRFGFASTSKTPKISNRERDASGEGTPSTAGSNERGFVTTRNHRRSTRQNQNARQPQNSLEIIPFPSLHSEETAASMRTVASDTRGSTPNNLKKTASRWKPSFLTEQVEKSSDEDMDVGSDGDELMEGSVSSPDGPPPSNLVNHFRPTPRDRTSRGTILADRPLGRPMEHLPHPGLTDAYLQGVRDAPADDPDVLDKVLYGTAPRSQLAPLVGTEIDLSLHQGASARDDASEITSLTMMTDYARRDMAGLMPSFPPREQAAKKPPATSPPEPRASLPAEDELPSDDFVEEWSLPDKEIKGPFVFELQGRSFLHEPLPPGWNLKTSKSHTRPYYVHPDRGQTWYCPIPLPGKSHARRYRKSGIGTKAFRKPKATKHATTRRFDYLSPKLQPTSFDASMSDLIKDYDQKTKITKLADDGYEASVSSRSSTESVVTLNTASSCHNASEEKNSSASKPSEGSRDWITPMRPGIKTPKERRPVSTKKSSTPALSPIEEDERAPTLADEEQPQEDHLSELNGLSNEASRKGAISSVQRETLYNVGAVSDQSPAERQSEGKRSTPRVSYEPLEITLQQAMISHGHSMEAPAASSAAKHRSEFGLSSMKRQSRSQSLRSPKPSKDRVPEASTPVSDSDNPDDITKSDSALRGATIEIASVRHSSHNMARRRLGLRAPLYTPPETLEMDTSTRHDAPMKRKSLQLVPGPHHETSADAEHRPEGIATEVATSLSHSDDETILEEELRPMSLPSQTHQIHTDAPALNGPESSTDESKISEYSAQRVATPNACAKVESQRNLEFEGDIDSRSNPDEWSPFREQPKPVFSPQRRGEPKPRSSSSPQSFAFETNDDDDSGDISFDVANHIDTPSTPIDETRVPSTIHGHSIASSVVESRDGRAASLSGDPSPLSFDLDDGAADSIQTQSIDDHGTESLFSQPLPKRSRTTFSWRVLHPFHPLCSLQRLDALLEAQRKRPRKAKRQKRQGKKKKATAQKRVVGKKKALAKKPARSRRKTAL